LPIAVTIALAPTSYRRQNDSANTNVTVLTCFASAKIDAAFIGVWHLSKISILELIDHKLPAVLLPEAHLDQTNVPGIARLR